MTTQTTTSPTAPGLLSAPQLLETVWPDKVSRPSLRYLRNLQAARMIPFVKLGGKVFFNPDDVRAAIADRHTVARRK